MVTDISSMLKDLKQDVLYTPKREAIISEAVRNFNRRGTEAERESRRYKNPKTFLRGKKSYLDKRIREARKEISNTPGSRRQVEQLEELVSQRKILDHLRIENGRVVFKRLEIPERVHNYRRLLQGLYRETLTTDPEGDFNYVSRAIVTFVRDPLRAASAIRNSADFEIILLDRNFELPEPFSQRFIKDPEKTYRRAFNIYLEKIIEDELLKQPGVTLRKLRRKNDIWREEMKWLKKDPKMRERAEDVVSDLLQLHYAYLVPYFRSRNEMAEAGKPEDIMLERLSRLRKDKLYFGLVYTGLDRHQRVFLTTNNSQGLLMLMFSDLVERLQNEGHKVRQSDIIRISQEYAHGSEGEVLSRSGIRQRYDPYISHVIDYDPRRPIPKDLLRRWTDLSGACHCLDAKYVGMLHESREYDFTYFCAHTIAVYLKHAQERLEEGRRVISPVVLPTVKQAYYENKLGRQVLVLKKEGGGVKERLNRGERELLNMRNIQELGPRNTLTADFEEAYQAMRSVYGHKFNL